MVISCGWTGAFSPVVENGKVYFVSDDGNLYCLDAEQGFYSGNIGNY